MTPEKKGPQNEGPQIVRGNGLAYDIIIPKIGKKISVRMSLGGLSTTMVEDLKPADENRLVVEYKLMKTTRKVISALLDSSAVSLSPGAEIEPEMRADELVKIFGDEVKDLRKMGVEKEEIEKMVKEQGKLFSTGKTVVDGIVTDLNGRIVSYFERADEAAKNKGSKD